MIQDFNFLKINIFKSLRLFKTALLLFPLWGLGGFGCSSATDNSLAGKKTQLAEMKTQAKELTAKITKLDEEIKAADPSMRAVEKILQIGRAHV